ncbi:MAG: hypothetical protein Q7S51_02860 [Gallionellaceae bacterium]|nr:hypothetical protein [Gallionellaceae bacterium]
MEKAAVNSSEFKLRKHIRPAILLAALLGLGSGAAWATTEVEVTVPVQVFADVGYFARTKGAATTTSNTSTTATATPQRNGAFIGTLTLFATPQIGDHVRSLLETVVEYNAAGTAALAVERAQIGYAYNDKATVWFGRFHTPYGFFNTAYHHGAQLTPSVTLPTLIRAAMPAHTVGLWMNGWTRTGSGKMTYDVYSGNATRVTPATSGTIDPNHNAENNQNKNVGFNLGYNGGDALQGLRVGIHAFTGKFTECTLATTSACSTATTQTRVKMYGAYAHYDKNDLEATVELYHYKNKDLDDPADTVSHGSSAGFVQVGYMVVPDVMPYARLEKTRYNTADAYFNALSKGRSYRMDVLGVRYNLNTNAALKAEISRTDSYNVAGISPAKELRLQYAIRF